MLETLNQIFNKNEVKRETIGILGFDELIQGGLPKGSFTVVSGGPGTGKSIFASQFICEGIIQHHQKGMYISVEQTRKDIIDQASQFGWDFETMEKEGNLKILALNSQELYGLQGIKDIKELIQNGNYDRIVIDSITSFVHSPVSSTNIANSAEKGMSSNTFYEISRANAAALIDVVKQSEITTLGIAQKIEGIPGDTVEMISEFKADGLIVLNATALGRTLNRTLQVKKLRKTKIDGVPHTFDFTEVGIKLLQ
jgi:circadian clock protein KaiC